MTVYCLIHGSDGGRTEYTANTPSTTTWTMQAVEAVKNNNTAAKIIFSAADGLAEKFTANIIRLRSQNSGSRLMAAAETSKLHRPPRLSLSW